MSGQWMDPAVDPRMGDGPHVDERPILLDSLRYHRMTLELKCEGLDAAQMARRSVPPSSLSLLGLVRHLADVERVWFREVLAGEDAPPHYWVDGNDQDFDGAVADDAMVSQAWATWKAEIENAERLVATIDDLAFPVPNRSRGDLVLREVLVHMVEEYARHNGHADLLREAIDGRTGE